MSMINLDMKIYPPSYLGSSSAAKSAQPKWINRTRLIEQLEGIREGEAIFLVCPNGSGKTTLIQSYLSPAIQVDGQYDPAGRSQNTAWLTLDPADNDPACFLTALIKSLHQHQPGIGAVVLSNLQAPSHPAILYETASLLQELSQVDHPITLVLDDYEAISSSRIQQAVIYLLSHIPPNLRLLVASSTELPPELEEARQRNHWKMLAFQDLKLSREETAELLEFYAHTSIDDQQAELLLDRTQGMAFAVQLAGAALQRHPEPAVFWQGLYQQPAPACVFLLDQLLQQQMDSVREFLLCTSILNRLTGPLCDMLMRASPSGLQASDRGRATLEYLSKNRLFTSVLDRSCTWYRYHPEFARLLLDRLNELHPTSLLPLHQRASYWFEVNDDFESATWHALASDDEERASMLIEKNVLSLVGSGQLHTTLTWLGKLSAGLVLLRPWLSLAEAWATAHEGWKQGVETLLANVETAAGTMASPAAQRARGHMAAIRSQIALKDDEASRADELSRQALELLPPQDRTIRCYIATQLGTALRKRGQLKSAAEAYSEAIACTNQGQNHSATILAFCHLADLHFVEGLFQKVLALSEEAIHLADIHRQQEGYLLPQSGLAHLYIGIVSLERDDVESAQSHLETSLEYCRVLGKWDAVSLGYAVLASLQHLKGNLDAARQAVSDSISNLSKFQAERTQPFPQSASFMALEPERIEARLVRLQLNWGDRQVVQEWITHHSYTPEDPFTIAQAPVYITLAQVLLAQGRVLDARRLVRRLLQTSENAGAVYNQVQALLLQARGFQQVQDYSSALASLQHALQLAEPERMVRVFIDETGWAGSAGSNDFNRLVRRASESGPGSVFARIILSSPNQPSLRTAVTTNRPVTQPLSSLEESRTEAFTDREKQIIRYLESYLSIVDIASQLSISPRTVDTLVRNLYRKLGVNEALQAVQRARELGII